MAIAVAGLVIALPLALPSERPVLAVAVIVVQAGCLLFARRSPGRTLAVVLVVGAPLLGIAPYLVSLGAVPVALCVLAWQRPPRESLLGLAVLWALAPLNLLEGGMAQVLLATTGAALAWTLGELVRIRVARAAEARERVREQERAAIARELHDVLAHSLSVIVVQSAAAGDVFESRPDAALEALASIEASSRAALADLRRVLDGVHAREPQPGLARLDALVASVGAAGVEVGVCVTGEPDGLPAVIDMSAYRIVQEALTNALRHAQAGRVEVAVDYAAEEVMLTVTDDGVGTPAVAGRGIIGMRERAVLLGGTLEAAPSAGGGFRVAARLPRTAP